MVRSPDPASVHARDWPLLPYRDTRVLTPCRSLSRPSFHAWRLLAARLRRDSRFLTMGLWFFRQRIPEPILTLDRYTRSLSSPSFDYIAYLSLSTSGWNMAYQDLIVLSDMANLGVLEILGSLRSQDPRCEAVSDNLAKGWSRRCSPFPSLRVLRLWGYASITQASLQSVSLFPALRFFDGLGASVDWEDTGSLSAKHGWLFRETPADRANELLRGMQLLAPLPHERRPHAAAKHAFEMDLIKRSLAREGAVCKVAVSAQTVEPRHSVNWAAWAAGLAQDATSLSDLGRDAVFDSWAFWLYSLIGAAHDDDDLRAQNQGPSHRAESGPATLPSKPTVCLCLGSFRPPGRDASRRVHFIFARDKLPVAHRSQGPTGGAPAVPPKSSADQPRIKRRKQRHSLDDILGIP